MMTADWEGYLRERFPGYLLPDAAATSLSVEAARRFLEAISGRPDQLDVLRAVSTLMSRASELDEFTRVSLPKLVRELPARTVSERKEWRGGFHGRLSIGETQLLHMQGRRAEFVTRFPRRTFDLPENVLVRAVCERLLGAISLLHRARVLPATGWGVQLRDVEGRLRHVLTSTALRFVPIESVTPFHEVAALAARNRVFHQTVEWSRVIRDGLDSDDPARIAEVVRNGALLPLESHIRFELAVVMRLVEAIETRLAAVAPGGWSAERAMIDAGRRDMVAFTSGEAVLRVYYNQSVLPAGPSDLGCAHYFGSPGRLRPDVTLTMTRHGVLAQAIVIEVKHSTDTGYLMSGFKEAVLYRWEYAPSLTGWPKSILVTSGPVPGHLDVRDDVVAMSWERWVPAEIVDAIVECLRPAGLRSQRG